MMRCIFSTRYYMECDFVVLSACQFKYKFTKISTCKCKHENKNISQLNSLICIYDDKNNVDHSVDGTEKKQIPVFERKKLR